MDGFDRQPNLPRREILEYLEVPFRRPLHCAIPLVLIVGAAVLMSFMLPKKYRATNLILVEQEPVPESFVPRVAAGDRGSRTKGSRLFTLRQEVLSRTRLEKVVNEVKPYPEKMGKVPMSNIIEDMRNGIAINVKGDDAFEVQFVHSNPRMAMAVANRLTSLFIEETAESREERVEGATDFIEQQLRDARRDLEVKEEALRRFKETRLGTLPEQTAANLSTLQRLQQEKQGVGDQLRGARDRQMAVEQGLQNQVRPTRGAEQSGQSLDPSVELAQLKSQLISLRSRYTDEHPEVRILLSRIGRLEVVLAESAAQAAQGKPLVDPAITANRSAVEQAKIEVRSLQARYDEMDQRINTFQARVEAAPRTEQELAILTRDYKQVNENYLSLLKKKMEAQMAEKLEQRWKGLLFKVLDPATLPDTYFFPNKTLFLVGGIVVGLVLGLSLAFLAEMLDHSIKTLPELEAVLPFPILATIPHVVPGKMSGKEYGSSSWRA